jgi:hypothetical protein
VVVRRLSWALDRSLTWNSSFLAYTLTWLTFFEFFFLWEYFKTKGHVSTVDHIEELWRWIQQFQVKYTRNLQTLPSFHRSVLCVSEYGGHFMRHLWVKIKMLLIFSFWVCYLTMLSVTGLYSVEITRLFASYAQLAKLIKTLKCDHVSLNCNSCNSARRSLGVRVHMNAFTYVDVHKSFCKIWHVIMKIKVKLSLCLTN